MRQAVIALTFLLVTLQRELAVLPRLQLPLNTLSGEAIWAIPAFEHDFLDDTHSFTVAGFPFCPPLFRWVAVAGEAYSLLRERELNSFFRVMSPASYHLTIPLFARIRRYIGVHRTNILAVSELLYYTILRTEVPVDIY